MDPKRVRIIAVVVVVVLVIAGIGVYFVLRNGTNCGIQSKNPLVFDQPERPDTLDPAVTFSTPGWAAVLSVYQPLISYNGSSYTTFVGILAQNWSVSADGFHYNFTLHPNIHFSNGDTVSAYTMWYTLYRGLVMTQATQFLLGENFWYPGLNYYSNASLISNATAQMITDLNTWDFTNPTATQLAAMEADNQSFRVLSPSVIQLNLGFGYLTDPITGAGIAYNYVLPEMSSPIAAAVDPKVVDAHGGVNQSGNDWMAQNMVGTGAYTQGAGYTTTSKTLTLTPDPNYWGASAASAQPWNNMIQPGKSTIELDFIQDTSILTQDVKTGAAASASFAYLGPSQIADLKSSSCVTVTALAPVYGATSGSWWVYMNQSVAPFNNWSVRAAVVHAINYTEIIQLGFGGLASQWVGPVPPGYPYYNPGSLSPYPYDLTLAKQEMAASPWPNGYTTPINYEYLNLGDWPNVALLLKNDLAKIGLNLNLVAVNNIGDLLALQAIDPSTGQCTSQEVPSTVGGPFPMGQEFYTSDYISPDDWTQNNAISYGTANQCMSGYANSTVDNLVIAAAGDHNPANLTADYTQITQMMYNNYTDAWLAVPTSYQVTNTQLQGMVTNPMGSTVLYTLLYNTVYAS